MASVRVVLRSLKLWKVGKLLEELSAALQAESALVVDVEQSMASATAGGSRWLEAPASRPGSPLPKVDSVDDSLPDTALSRLLQEAERSPRDDPALPAEVELSMALLKL